MKMNYYFLGRISGIKKVQVYETQEEAQIHATDGWSQVAGFNLQSAIKKYEEGYKITHNKKEDKNA